MADPSESVLISRYVDDARCAYALYGRRFAVSFGSFARGCLFAVYILHTAAQGNPCGIEILPSYRELLRVGRRLSRRKVTCTSSDPTNVGKENHTRSRDSLEVRREPHKSTALNNPARFPEVKTNPAKPRRLARQASSSKLVDTGSRPSTSVS